MIKLYHEKIVGMTPSPHAYATFIAVEGYVRDEQAEANAALGAEVRDWLGSYGLKAKELRQWIANPLDIKRLTSQCSESLYKHLISALEKEESDDPALV